MSHNVDDPLRGELADIRAAAEHALGICDPGASVSTLVDLLATEHRNLQAAIAARDATIAKLRETLNESEHRRIRVRIAEDERASSARVASIVAFLAAEATRFDREARERSSVADLPEMLRAYAVLCRTLELAIERGDDLRGGE